MMATAFSHRDFTRRANHCSEVLLEFPTFIGVPQPFKRKLPPFGSQTPISPGTPIDPIWTLQTQFNCHRAAAA